MVIAMHVRNENRFDLLEHSLTLVAVETDYLASRSLAAVEQYGCVGTAWDKYKRSKYVANDGSRGRGRGGGAVSPC